jgi:hypothetical protein
MYAFLGASNQSYQMIRDQGQRSKLGQVIILIKTLYLEYFSLDQLQIWCESGTWTATQLISFKGRSPMTFMVSARVENGVPHGQTSKSMELYRVVPHMKALDEHFPNQLKFGRYEVI